MKYHQGRMGKAIACPSTKGVGIDGHVVPPLPILRCMGLAADADLDKVLM